MARPKAIDLKAGEAKFVLEALYRDGMVSSDVMSEYRGRYEGEVRSLEARINYLKSLGTQAAAAVAGAAAAVPQLVERVRQARVSRGTKARLPKRGGKGGRGRKAETNAPGSTSSGLSERELVRKLQGRYLGLLRQIPASRKKRFGREAIAAKGKEAVVAEMETYLAGRASKAGRKK